MLLNYFKTKDQTDLVRPDADPGDHRAPQPGQPGDLHHRDPQLRAARRATARMCRPLRCSTRRPTRTACAARSRTTWSTCSGGIPRRVTPTCRSQTAESSTAWRRCAPARSPPSSSPTSTRTWAGWMTTGTSPRRASRAATSPYSAPTPTAPSTRRRTSTTSRSSTSAAPTRAASTTCTGPTRCATGCCATSARRPTRSCGRGRSRWSETRRSLTTRSTPRMAGWPRSTPTTGTSRCRRRSSRTSPRRSPTAARTAVALTSPRVPVRPWFRPTGRPASELMSRRPTMCSSVS